MNQRFKLNSVIFSAIFFVFSNYVVSDELPVRMDEYDLVERKHLEGLFAKPNVCKNFCGTLMFLSETDGAKFLFPMKKIQLENAPKEK